MSNEIKSEQLGMPYGTACNRLRKTILFKLVQQLDLDVCFQCGNKIESVDELSIEHKSPWMYNENSVEMFFDLDNIAFSHLKCNCSTTRSIKNRKKYKLKHPSLAAYKRGCRCELCSDLKKKRSREISIRNSSYYNSNKDKWNNEGN